MRGRPTVGRPYFVMELVKGVPITEYCDDTHLTTARATGIVHRRLPRHPARASKGHHPPRHQASNMLVAQHDDQPVVKVIDFGVAKACTSS